MTSLLMVASVGLAVVNGLLAAILLLTYRRIYVQTRTSFTAALLLFAVAFIAQSALVIYSYLDMMVLIPEQLTPYLFGIGLFEATGLATMVWTSRP
jgi:hypothetical protein